MNASAPSVVLRDAHRRIGTKLLITILAWLALPFSVLAAAPSTTPPTTQKPPLLAVKVDGRNEQDFLRGLAEFEKWLGRPVQGVLAYTGVANWTDYEGSVGWQMGIWGKADRPALWSIPLIPGKGNGKEKITLADAGKGLYNAHYKKVAEKLAKFRPNDPVIYVRTGWEFNGGWFPWTVHGGKGDDFIAAFRQFVTTFRSVSPRFRFDWCPVWGDQLWEKGKARPLGDFYPGDEYVDVIGLDVYDEKKYTKIDDPVKRWQFYLKRGHGLNWHRAFAAKHNKPMAYPEWGVGDGGDDPYFVEQFHQWIRSNNVLYHVYWNSNAGYTGKLTTGKFPQSAEKYKALFGGDARQ
ncbi:MAG TPA: glycosyl hydrolase [Steroidobacteraceae bacterium]